MRAGGKRPTGSRYSRPPRLVRSPYSHSGEVRHPKRRSLVGSHHQSWWPTIRTELLAVVSPVVSHGTMQRACFISNVSHETLPTENLQAASPYTLAWLLTFPFGTLGAGLPSESNRVLIAIQRIHDKATEQFWKEVSALGWHAFVVKTDPANVLNRGRHN